METAGSNGQLGAPSTAPSLATVATLAVWLIASFLLQRGVLRKAGCSFPLAAYIVLVQRFQLPDLQTLPLLQQHCLAFVLPGIVAWRAEAARSLMSTLAVHLALVVAQIGQSLWSEGWQWLVAIAIEYYILVQMQSCRTSLHTATALVQSMHMLSTMMCDGVVLCGSDGGVRGADSGAMMFLGMPDTTKLPQGGFKVCSAHEHAKEFGEMVCGGLSRESLALVDGSKVNAEVYAVELSAAQARDMSRSLMSVLRNMFVLDNPVMEDCGRYMLAFRKEEALPSEGRPGVLTAQSVGDASSNHSGAAWSPALPMGLQKWTASRSDVGPRKEVPGEAGRAAGRRLSENKFQANRVKRSSMSSVTSSQVGSYVSSVAYSTRSAPVPRHL
mmetsp:Transcript_57808/g.135143  ORF Transcript_57808/g.135143 Transcript_57808/m.135143 type:complete len:385 (-) Transcript_57808:108-1262(-)